ncbi:hypothetical protein R4Y45_06160 [Holzapfeliella sp. He02]|uniref:Uncharacterized protein n=1 Tax=Holzapfeliella saturejae TaxID=3082953 RepID=A0ABU8SHH5_9LACO
MDLTTVVCLVLFIFWLVMEVANFFLNKKSNKLKQELKELEEDNISKRERIIEIREKQLDEVLKWIKTHKGVKND